MNNATKMLTDNLKQCQEMDRMLGTGEDLNDYTSEEEEETSPNTERCPIHNCNSTIVKLKRHLTIHKLDDCKRDYAIKCSKIFAQNSNQMSSTSTKIAKPSNTNLVNRKCNYKICPICNNLYMNMSDHLKHFHKMSSTDPNYESYVKNCAVVPKCYTKKKEGKVKILTDKSMEEAKSKYEAEINSQQKILNQLKTLRHDIKTTSERLRVQPTEEDTKKLEELYKEYTEQRYKDSAVYTDKVNIWKSKFEEHLERRGDSNPKRGVAMVMAVMTPNFDEEISLQELLDASYIRSKLDAFKLNKSTNSTSKLKYIKYFELFIKYLCTDVSSPEYKDNQTNDEIITQDIKLKTISNEIETALSHLSKNRGRDLVTARKKATSKLIKTEDSSAILQEIEDFLRDISTKDEQELQAMDMKQVRQVRDALVVAPTIRLSRRSKELMSMTLEECANPETREVKGKTIKIIKVLDQKNVKSGKPAPILYTESEYCALTAYVNFLRPKFSNDITIDNVFLTTSYQSNRPTPLTYSAIYKILQKFKTKSGKKLSSRALRGSMVTESRKKNYSNDEQKMLADAMSHSIATANRSYNFTEISDSVVKLLNFQESQQSQQSNNPTTPATSTPAKQDSQTTPAINARKRKYHTTRSK